ncbi:helix-hairpin-helix domain-containing protein [Flavobacterium cerinum]|uniref:Helix-hairpin-helix domain-containing protein n=1 Tax=Flavobacterium cerinum TaxID=2502784 RepID=A0A444HFX8_9FLAO|nr:helix-hairpin-helix domain-containing protein [Flavobacterium cerinum]RWX03862.1 helix-hairpin-helix domain-containing protein [Flavobacterium cerinum]
MKLFQFFFRFTSNQRKGIIALFILMIMFQVGYFILTSSDFTSKKEKSEEEKLWLAFQTEIDALKAKKNTSKDTIYPFNPNFISDYRGYMLGLSVQEIDRLHKFRKSGEYVNSVADFKKVTGVSDSLLLKLSPYFKFPDWIKDIKTSGSNVYLAGEKSNPYVKEERSIKVIDINDALEEDLIKVYGIGPYYAKAILRRRADLGAFVSMDQMDDFKEFSEEAKAGLKKSFKTESNPLVNKINVNTASLLQLSRFPYFSKEIARGILTQRSMNGRIKRIDELLEISSFPVDKVKIIALYLEF